jgi:hypothetical protein
MDMLLIVSFTIIHCKFRHCYIHGKYLMFGDITTLKSLVLVLDSQLNYGDLYICNTLAVLLIVLVYVCMYVCM